MLFKNPGAPRVVLNLCDTLPPGRLEAKIHSPDTRKQGYELHRVLPLVALLPPVRRSDRIDDDTPPHTPIFPATAYPEGVLISVCAYSVHSETTGHLLQ